MLWVISLSRTDEVYRGIGQTIGGVAVVGTTLLIRCSKKASDVTDSGLACCCQSLDDQSGESRTYDINQSKNFAAPPACRSSFYTSV